MSSFAVDDVVSVFIHKHQGERIAKLVDSGVTVTLDISVGQALSVYNAAENETDHHDHTTRLSPLAFVSLHRHAADVRSWSVYSLRHT